MNDSLMNIDIKNIFQKKLNHITERNFYFDYEKKVSDEFKSRINDRIFTIFNDLMSEQGFEEYITLLKKEGPQFLDHSMNTGILASIISMIMFFSEKDIQRVLTAGILHDIGKISEIKNSSNNIEDGKNGSRVHVRNGTEFLKNKGNVDEVIIKIISQHHEKADGTGEPYHLKEEEILPASLIVSVSDHYDYFLNRNNNISKETVGKPDKNAENYFGHDLITVLRKKFIPYPLTTIVRLSDHRIGVVEKLNTEDLSRPIIKIVKQMATKIIIDEVDLHEHSELHIVEVLKETPNPSVQSYLKKGYN